jgi:ZIP family zinc transporter
MLNAFVLGAVSQLSLIVSGLMVFLVSVPKRLVGALAAFGAGALIAAVARDLLPEAHVLQLAQASLWAMLGAVAFIAGEDYVDEKFGSEGAAGALGIVVGSVVDGVPESVIFGIQLASGEPLSAAFIAAVFVSNIPQALAPSADLAATGWNWRRVAGLWSWVVLACGVASVLGYGAVRVVPAVARRAHGVVRIRRHSGHAVKLADPVRPRTIQGRRLLDRRWFLHVVRHVLNAPRHATVLRFAASA